MHRISRRAAVALLAGLTAACATTSVGSHVQRGLDVSQYKTYAWGPADALPTGDARLDQNPFFKDQFEGAVEKGLAARGFTNATGGNPDLLIHYHASITRRIDVNRVDREYGYCYDDNCDARVFDYEAGTLVLDVVDPRTNRVIWRGWAQRVLGDMLENQDQMARQIDEAVTRMLEHFLQAN